MSVLTLKSERVVLPTPATGKAILYAQTADERLGQIRLAKHISGNGNAMFLGDFPGTNYLRNSDFRFNLRTTLTGIRSITTANVNRWKVQNGWSLGVSLPAPDSAFSETIRTSPMQLQARTYGRFRTNSLGNGSKMMLTQVLDSWDTAALRGQRVLFQIWVNLEGDTALNAAAQRNTSIRLGLISHIGTPDVLVDPLIATTAWNTSPTAPNSLDPTLSTNLSYVRPVAGIDRTCVPDVNGVTSRGPQDTWRRVGAFFDVPANATNLIVAIWTPIQVRSAPLHVSQASLTLGSAIVPWTVQDQQTEYNRVRAFYQKSMAIGTSPAVNQGLANAVRGYVNVAGRTANQVIGIALPVPLQVTTGTVSALNPSAANNFVRNTQLGTDASATAISINGQGALVVTFTGLGGGGAWAVMQPLAIHYSVDCEL